MRVAYTNYAIGMSGAEHSRRLRLGWRGRRDWQAQKAGQPSRSRPSAIGIPVTTGAAMSLAKRISSPKQRKEGPRRTSANTNAALEATCAQ